MNDRTVSFRVGLVLFATICITAILTVINSRSSFLPFKKQYLIKILVDQAPGVAPGTPVRRRGVLIGRVADVVDVEKGALITANIDDGKTVRANEVARVQASLIGDAVIEFVSGSQPNPKAGTVAPGETVKGVHNPNPLDLLANIQGDLKQTIMSLGSAGDEVAKLANQVNAVLGTQDVNRIARLLESTEQAMQGFNQTMADVDDLLGDAEFRQQLKDGIAQLPGAISDARSLIGGLEGAIGSADANLKNLQGLTGPLGERGDQIVASLEQSALNLQNLLGQVAEFTLSINNSQGTLGLLVHNRELYDQVLKITSQLSSTVRDVQMLIREPRTINRLIRQILDEVHVVTNKMARDPARIVRGVIKPETRIK
jgi:phospholipid/cholesterol/gamma-HCH transport system substrate-binding protein